MLEAAKTIENFKLDAADEVSDENNEDLLADQAYLDQKISELPADDSNTNTNTDADSSCAAGSSSNSTVEPVSKERLAPQ